LSEPLESIRRQHRECRSGICWIRLPAYQPGLGQLVDDAADLDGDSIANLIEYAFGFSPLAQNPPGAGFQVSTAPAGANTTLTITFRRDPRAVDLTYVLQTSSDLINWTTIAQSSGSTRLDEGALNLVKAGARYISPAMEDGKPVDGCIDFRVKFQMTK
jgi:hypothetical protein